LSAGATSDYTIVGASALAQFNDRVLALLAEVTLEPSFPENEVALAKQNTKESLRQQRAQPSFLASEMVSRVMFGDHPYSVVAPTPEQMDGCWRDEFVSFHRSKLVPNNAVFIVVGNVNYDDILKRTESLFSTWKRGEDVVANFPAPPVRTRRTAYLVDRPGSAQSNIVIANSGITRTDPDYFPMLLMHTVLGANASSRLFMNLREDKGYTYGAYSSLAARRTAATFRAMAEVRTPVTGDSLKEFFYELNRIRDERVSDEELTDAKNFLTGVFPSRAETQEGLTNLIVNQQLYGLADDYLQTYRDNVNAITAEDVQRVAREYITPDKMSIVIVGDGAELVGQATPFAESVEIFDTEGHPRDIAVYNSAPDAPTADVAGSWKLMLDFQGQQVPVSLTVEQDGESITGKLETVLGNGTISEGSAKGRKLSA